MQPESSWSCKPNSNRCTQNYLERVIQKAVEERSVFIANKIVDKILKVSRTWPQNTSEVVTNETENIGLDRDIPN